MTTPELFKPVESKRAFETIAEQVKDLIYSGRLKAGDKLPTERELAATFKTGRMVVRESLRMLEQSGFIYVKNGYKGGTFVKTAGADVMTGSIVDMVKLGKIGLDQLTETRLEVELAIIGLAIERIEEDDFDQLLKNIEHTETLISEGKISRDGNIAFHLILANASKNYLLSIIVESIMNVVYSFVERLKPDITHSKKILAEHRAIYDAVRRKDKESARKLMRDHILNIEGRWLALVKANRRTE